MVLSADAAADLFRSPPDQYLDVGDASLAYRRVGEGPDVVFSHGWPASGATFRRMLPHLVEHVTCHVVDLPGAGDSRFDRSTSISITDHAQALRRCVDDLGLTSFGVVGHDSGGMIARFAFSGDPRVHGWGLIATEQPPKAHWRFSSFLAVRFIPRFEEILARVVTRPGLRRNKFILGDAFADKDLLGGEFEEFFLQPLRDDPERRWAAGEFGRNFDLGLFADLMACHREITVPVQLVWGAQDPFFPVQRARDMMGQFSGPVDLEVVEDAKLFVHEEYPQRAAHAILDAVRG